MRILYESSENNMLEITKDEAKYLRAHGVSEGITRTMRQKSKRGKKQLVAEERYILRLLDEYKASQKVIMTYGEV